MRRFDPNSDGVKMRLVPQSQNRNCDSVLGDDDGLANGSGDDEHFSDSFPLVCSLFSGLTYVNSHSEHFFLMASDGCSFAAHSTYQR